MEGDYHIEWLHCYTTHMIPTIEAPRYAVQLICCLVHLLFNCALTCPHLAAAGMYILPHCRRLHLSGAPVRLTCTETQLPWR